MLSEDTSPLSRKDPQPKRGALAAASFGLLASQVDAAFCEAVDKQMAELFNS